MKRWAVFFVVSLLCACSQPSNQDTRAEKKEHEKKTYTPSKGKDYKPSDGGFGTLDEARDVRKESQDQQQDAQNALDQTE